MNKLAQSYVYYKEKIFFVSTINRKSSVIYDNTHIYSETIVMERSIEEEKFKKIIYQDSDVLNSIDTHQLIVKNLHAKGKCV